MFNNCPFSKGREDKYGDIERKCETLSCALWDDHNRCCHFVSISKSLQGLACNEKIIQSIPGDNGRHIYGDNGKRTNVKRGTVPL